MCMIILTNQNTTSAVKIIILCIRKQKLHNQLLLKQFKRNHFPFEVRKINQFYEKMAPDQLFRQEAGVQVWNMCQSKSFHWYFVIFIMTAVTSRVIIKVDFPCFFSYCNFFVNPFFSLIITIFKFTCTGFVVITSTNFFFFACVFDKKLIIHWVLLRCKVLVYSFDMSILKIGMINNSRKRGMHAEIEVCSMALVVKEGFFISCNVS